MLRDWWYSPVDDDGKKTREVAARSRDMFRMYRYKDHFEYRKLNPEVKVAEGVYRKGIVPVTGTWDDSKMYAPYPYTDSAFNPNM